MPAHHDLPTNYEDWLTASRIVAGGMTFFLVLSVSQLVQGRMGISAASQLSQTAGLLSVGVGSFTASLAADQAPSTLSAALGWKTPSSSRSRTLLSSTATITKPSEEQALQALRTACLGLLLFKGLGGRFNSISPSDVTRPGAFFRFRGTLHAGPEYASPLQKRRLDMFGLLYGCHSCGKRQVGSYIGDHMPPKKVAARMSKRWWRRILCVR